MGLDEGAGGGVPCRGGPGKGEGLKLGQMMGLGGEQVDVGLLRQLKTLLKTFQARPDQQSEG